MLLSLNLLLASALAVTASPRGEIRDDNYYKVLGYLDETEDYASSPSTTATPYSGTETITSTSTVTMTSTLRSSVTNVSSQLGPITAQQESSANPTADAPGSHVSSSVKRHDGPLRKPDIPRRAFEVRRSSTSQDDYPNLEESTESSVLAPTAPTTTNFRSGGMDPTSTTSATAVETSLEMLTLMTLIANPIFGGDQTYAVISPLEDDLEFTNQYDDEAYFIKFQHNVRGRTIFAMDGSGSLSVYGGRRHGMSAAYSDKSGLASAIIFSDDSFTASNEGRALTGCYIDVMSNLVCPFGPWPQGQWWVCGGSLDLARPGYDFTNECRFGGSSHPVTIGVIPGVLSEELWG